MTSVLAAYFQSLHGRFSPLSAPMITEAQHTFEAMRDMTEMARPAACRSAHFEIAGSRFLVWEMDEEMDRFQVFATVYNIPLGILRLSAAPKGKMVVAGFPVDLEALVDFIRTTFGAARRPSPESLAAPKRKLLLFGFCESFGHHFWNEVSGLAAVMQTGLFDQLDGIVVGPFDYFHLEPMLRARGKPVWKSNSTGALLADQLLIYRNHVVTEEARRLVIDHAASLAEPSPRDRRRGICFQIRRHRRPWLHEEERLAEIIGACAREWPDMAFTIDGFGRSKGIIPIYEEQIAEETACAARLAARLPGIDLRTTIGMDINDKINCLKHTDAFIGPIGSGGVFSSWLLRRPTICYGPTGFYDILQAQEETVPEGGPMAVAVPRDRIIDSGDSVLSFDIPAAAIFDLIRQTMNRAAAA